MLRPPEYFTLTFGRLLDGANIQFFLVDQDFTLSEPLDSINLRQLPELAHPLHNLHHARQVLWGKEQSI